MKTIKTDFQFTSKAYLNALQTRFAMRIFFNILNQNIIRYDEICRFLCE